VHPLLEDLYPLSPMQEGLLFHSLESPGSGVHITQHAWTLRRLDVDAFARAWQWVLDRHAILRSAFVWKNTATPLQAVVRRVPLAIAHEDWRGLSRDERKARLDAYLARDRHQDFALNRAPLFRLALMALDGGRHQLVLTQHHILLDGWSLPLLFADVTTAYRAFVSGREPSAPARAPFRDYIAWLQRQNLDDTDRFWRDLLAGFQGQRASSPSRDAGDRSRADERRIMIPETETDALKRWCRARRITVNTAFQGAWALVLGRVRQMDDVVFGAIVSGRPVDLPGVETLLGVFINTIPVRARMGGALADDVAVWLRRLQDEHGQASRYAYTPLPRIKRCSQVPAHEPLFDTAINFLNYPRPAMDFDATAGAGAGDGDAGQADEDEAIYATSNAYRLSLLVGASDAALSVTMLAEPDLFPSAVTERIGPMLRAALDAFVAADTVTVSDVVQRLRDLDRQAMASDRRAAFRHFTAARAPQPVS